MLEEIARLIMAGDLAACGQRAAAAVEDGVTDFRIIAGFALGVFEERGPEALPEIAEAIRASLADHWENVRPASRKERVVDSALSLALRVLRSSVDFHEAQRDSVWTRWMSGMAPDLADRCLEAFHALEGAVIASIDQPQSSGEIGRLMTRAELSFRPNPSSEPSMAEPQTDEPLSDAHEAQGPVEAEPAAVREASADDESEAAADCGSPEATALEASGRLLLEKSGAMDAFLRKLEAFELLVSRDQMAKAAIVAQDVREIIDNFDPRVYLPGLLAPHFRLLNEHIDAIAPHWEAAGDPAARARQQLYKVDLNGFIES